MSKIEKLLKKMEKAPQNVNFADLVKVCTHYFGEPRNKASSHHVYKMPWQGNPRVNIQENKDGSAKPYQVKQVLAAIRRKKSED